MMPAMASRSLLQVGATSSSVNGETGLMNGKMGHCQGLVGVGFIRMKASPILSPGHPGNLLLTASLMVSALEGKSRMTALMITPFVALEVFDSWHTILRQKPGSVLASLSSVLRSALPFLPSVVS
jgi:hypothetical protein